MNNDDVLSVALRQSAVDCNASPEDFLRDENVIVESRPHPKARRYLDLPLICDLVSYGPNVVASGAPEALPAISRFLEAQKEPYRCFETPQIYALNELLSPFDAKVCFMAEYFLPNVEDVERMRDNCGLSLRILEAEELAELHLPEWGNALSHRHPELDVLAVGAYDGAKLAGLAGCSADCDDMWQIGVDVLPEYRRRGAASAVTGRLARVVLERGKVPFYCAAWSNVASVRNALRSGFRPGWVEITAKTNAFIHNML